MTTRVLRLAALAAFFLVSRTASAQTFGEFLNNPALPVTFLGVDFSQARYYGPAMTVDSAEMKTQFTKIDELLVQEADKYDIAKSLHRSVPVVYAINVAEARNTQIVPATIIVPSSEAARPAFTTQTIDELTQRYTLPAGGAGVGLVFVVESIDKNTEQETFWATFVDLATKKVLYTVKTNASGAGFGFRNHWARPLNAGLDLIKSHYGQWKKKLASS